MRTGKNSKHREETWSNTLTNILVLPMALGELGLAVWLIIKGGKLLK